MFHKDLSRPHKDQTSQNNHLKVMTEIINHRFANEIPVNAKLIE